MSQFMAFKDPSPLFKHITYLSAYLTTFLSSTLQLFLCKLPMQPQATLYKMHLAFISQHPSAHPLYTPLPTRWNCCSSDSQHSIPAPPTKVSWLLTQVHFSKCKEYWDLSRFSHFPLLYKAVAVRLWPQKNKTWNYFCIVKSAMFKVKCILKGCA